MTDTGTPTLGEREKKKPKGELKEEQLGSWKERMIIFLANKSES